MDKQINQRSIDPNDNAYLRGNVGGGEGGRRRVGGGGGGGGRRGRRRRRRRKKNSWFNFITFFASSSNATLSMRCHLDQYCADVFACSPTPPYISFVLQFYINWDQYITGNHRVVKNGKKIRNKTLRGEVGGGRGRSVGLSVGNEVGPGVGWPIRCEGSTVGHAEGSSDGDELG